jgi:multidrug efflux pump subunit AcrA (membrane-fusion protein)
MKPKQIGLVAGGVFLAVLIWRIAILVVGDRQSSPQGFGRPPVAVEVDSVRYEPIQETMQMTGSIYPLYGYIVAPKVSGRIIRISKRIGDWVKPGEVIAKIDDGEYQQMMLEAEAIL